MFHSSSSRHEQYLIRSSPSKATLHKKRSSLESEVSGADSGYTSSSSSLPSGSPTSTTQQQQQEHHVIATKKNRDSNDDDNISTATTDQTIISTATSNINTDASSIVTTGTTKKKKSKRQHQQQPPRQPDLVYSCPRPLAFPFHNDDHFLPIAEADPRDVARVSPSSGLNRSSSLQSSIGSTRMYDSTTSSMRRGTDAESSYSHQSSILSTIQRGTVRSIKSLFQLPDSSASLSNRDGSLHRVQTNSTTYSSTTRLTTDSSTMQQPKLEIKKGTVQSIKDMFSMKRASLGRVTQPVPISPQKGYVGATIGQFESSSSLYSRANINAIASKNKKQAAPPVFKPVAVNVTKSESKKSFTARATQFASKAFWRSSSKTNSSTPPPTTAPTAANNQSTSSLHAATKPLPKTPSPPKQSTSIKSEVKKLSARVFSFGSKASSNNVSPTPPRTTTDDAAPKKKRSFFSSFQRSDLSVDTKKKPTTENEEEFVPATTTTTMGKMWKSFKNLVTGRKSSRVGVL